MDARLSGEPAVFRPISVAEIGKGSAFGAGLLQSVSSGGDWKHFGFRPNALPKPNGLEKSIAEPPVCPSLYDKH